MIEMVVADLSEQLEIPVKDIEISSAISVTWPDTTLGCPNGISGAQMITKGWRIILTVANETYYYHTNDVDYFVQCPTEIASQSTDYQPTPLSVQLSQAETMMDDTALSFVHLIGIMLGMVTLFTVLSYREQK